MQGGNKIVQRKRYGAIALAKNQYEFNDVENILTEIIVCFIQQLKKFIFIFMPSILNYISIIYKINV